MTVLLLAMTIAIPIPPFQVQGGSYVVEEMGAETASAQPPLTIIRVVAIPGGLRLFVSCDSPAAVQELLSRGALEAQLSDHRAGRSTDVSLSFGRAVWCSEDGLPVYPGYLAPLPECDGQPPARIEYFFEANATPGAGRDLAIGLEPCNPLRDASDPAHSLRRIV